MRNARQVTELLRMMSLRVTQAEAELARAARKVAEITRELQALQTPCIAADPSLSGARVGLLHEDWRAKRRREVAQDLALAKAAEASCQSDLGALRAKQEALISIKQDFERDAQIVVRRDQEVKLLSQAIRRQTS